MSNIIEKYIISMGYDGKKAAEGLASTDKSLDKVKKSSKTASKSMKDDANDAAKAFSGIRTELTLLAGAFVSVSGIKSFLSNSISDITKLGYASKNLGITTEKLEQFQLANEKLGGSKGGITSYFTKITKELGELRTHGRGMFTEGGDLYSFLARLGNRSTSDLKSSEDAVYLISDMLKEAFSESEATGLNVAERLGIDGETLNLLRLGSKEVRAFVEEQKKYATISAEEAKKTQQFGIEIDNVKDSFTATGREIFIGLLPVLKQVNSTFGELGDWFNKNKEGIGKTIGTWTTKASEFIKALFGDDNKIQSTLDSWSSKFERLIISLERLAKAAGIVSDTYEFLNPEEYKKDAKRPRYQSGGVSALAEQYYPAIKGALTGKPEKQLADAARKYGFDYGKVRGAFSDAARQYGVDEGLLMAQAYQESRFNPNAGSSAGAVGFAQFMSGTAKTYGLKDRRDPVQSIHAQARYMRKLIDQFGGREDLALAGYNAGEYRKSLNAGMIPNIPETQNYVKKIMSDLSGIRGSQAQSVNNSTSNAQTVNIGTLNLKSDNTDDMMKDIISKSVTPKMSNQFSNSGVR